jgi:hypothetical protein
VLCIVRFLSLSPDAERARFWTLVRRGVAPLFIAATRLITCVFIRYYMPWIGCTS